MSKLSIGSLVLLALGGVTLAAGGCHRRAEPAPDSQAAKGAAAVATADPPGGGMRGVTKPVMDLLTEERAARPAGTPGAEAVFAAVTKAGVPTHDQTQVLAKTLGASFCENARTDQGVVLGVCEFNDADTLARGRAYSLKTFAKALPNRRLLVNRNTLLTVNPPGNSDQVTAELKIIDRAFASL